MNTAMIKIIDEVVGNGREVLRAIVTFAVIPRRFGLKPDEVEAAAKASFDQPDSTFPLADLIGSREIQKFAKALDLRNAYERIFLASRIVTDIRPVFDDDEVGAFDAAMINHTLQLRLRADDAESDIHIAVDLDDLETLKSQIERAIKKEESSRKFVAKGEATLLEALE